MNNWSRFSKVCPIPSTVALNDSPPLYLRAGVSTRVYTSMYYVHYKYTSSILVVYYTLVQQKYICEKRPCISIALNDLPLYIYEQASRTDKIVIPDTEPAITQYCHQYLFIPHSIHFLAKAFVNNFDSTSGSYFHCFE